MCHNGWQVVKSCQQYFETCHDFWWLIVKWNWVFVLHSLASLLHRIDMISPCSTLLCHIDRGHAFVAPNSLYLLVQVVHNSWAQMIIIFGGGMWDQTRHMDTISYATCEIWHFVRSIPHRKWMLYAFRAVIICNYNCENIWHFHVLHHE